MAAFGRTFRLFVSSTFSDLKAERDVLQRRVFPRLRELCHQHGARFQAIDLRWGVSDEAALDQQTMNLCLREISRCREVTPRPNFIVLLGQRYGWRPLPAQIPAKEFEAPKGSPLLEEWYKRDDNAVPAEYCLQPRSGEYAEAEAWEPVEGQLREALVEAARRAGLTGDAMVKYGASATEQEIREGALLAEDSHAFCYYRTIEGAQAGEFVDEGEAAQRLAALKEEIAKYVPEDRTYRYTAQWRDGELTEAHLDALCARVEADLSRVILAELDAMERVGDLETERDAHQRFGDERRRGFLGQQEPVEAIREYLSRGHAKPLVVWGTSGCGKSALMAQAAHLAAQEQPAAVIVTKYIGATPASTDVRSLLESLCREIAEAYGDATPVPPSYDELRDDLPRRLGLATKDRPLIVFLDALDQLNATGGAHYQRWLPMELPENVRLVASALDREGEAGQCLQVLRVKLPDSLVEVRPLSADEGDELLSAWLGEVGRTLQPEQRQAVMAKFGHCPLPLYLRLAFEEVRQWKSYDGVPEVGDDIEGVLNDLLDALATPANHGEVMTRKSLGYLAAARNGLTEDELVDVLSADEEVMADFRRRSPRSPEVDRLPVVVWSRLSHDLSPYMAERAADETSLLVFYHRQVREVVEKRYLVDEDGVALHSGLGEYFAPQEPNLRQTSELPWQQTRGQDWDGLEKTLTELRFLEAKVEAGRVFDLVADLNAADSALPRDRHGARILRLLGRALVGDLYFIVLHPTTLFQCLWNRAWWYDCSEAAKHYDPPGGGWGPDGPPWQRPEPKLCTLLERWRKEKEARQPGFVWVRSLRPPPSPVGGAQVACLRGHEQSVTSVVFSPDGTRVASGSRDNTVRLWEVATGHELACLRGHEQFVTSVVFSPDGTRVASGSWDNTVRLWEVATGHELACLRGHEQFVTSVVFSPDGTRVASGSWDNTVRLWEVATGHELACLRGHEGLVTSVAFSPDGSCIASGCHDGTIRLWGAATGEEFACLSGHGVWVCSVAWDPRGERIVSGSGEPGGGNVSTVRIWDAVAGKELACLCGDHWGSLCVAFSPDGSRIASGSDDSTVRVWDAGTGKELACLRWHDAGVNSIAFSPDGARIASGSDDDTVRIWDATILQAFPCVRGHEGVVHVKAFSPDGMRLAGSAWDNTVRVWDAGTGHELTRLRGHEGGISSVVFSCGVTRIASGSSDSTVRVWAAETGAELACLRGHRDAVMTAAFSPDGTRIASGSKDGTVRVWNAGTGWELACLRGHESTVGDVVFSPDGMRVVSGSGEWPGRDGTVRVWDARTGAELACLRGHEGVVWSVAFSPDGAQIASGGWDKTLRLWDSDHGGELTCLRGHERDVFVLAFSPDGMRLASQSFDKTVRVWDAGTGKCLEVIEGYGDVAAIAAGPPCFPWRALGRTLDTAIEDAADGMEVAWFPVALGHIVTHPSGLMWAGSGDDYLAIIALEGPPSTPARSEEGQSSWLVHG